MRSVITIAFLVLQLMVITANGQQDKAVKKAISTYNSGKIDKGISMMEKVVLQNPSDDNWESLIEMYYSRYNYARNCEINAMVAVVGNSMGAKMKVEKYTSSRICFQDLVLKCYEAGLTSRCLNASMYLRSFFVDFTPDTAIAKDVKADFEKAESYFTKKDFKNAKNYYYKAYQADTSYYKACIYLGDSYWYLDDMDSAVYYFSRGIALCPTLLEPRKYIVDALAYSGDDAKAIDQFFETLYIYPDESMFLKYGSLLKNKGKVFNRHWVPRGCQVNGIGNDSPTARSALWTSYQKAKDEIAQYCDSNGVIKTPNALTNTKYLEVYSWEKMLKSNASLPDEMKFAKEMADKGFLDCYVFISVFHFGLYDQYTDFVKNNRDRIRQYVETYLVN